MSTEEGIFSHICSQGFFNSILLEIATEASAGIELSCGLHVHKQMQALELMRWPWVCRWISHKLIENGGDGQMTPLLRLAAGAGAGIVGMSATYPLDMVRGRLTVQSMEGVHRYRGIMHATAVIVKEASSLTPTLIPSISFTCLAFGLVSTAQRC